MTTQTARADGGVMQVDQRINGREILVYTSRGPFTEGISIDVSVLVEHYPSGQLVPTANVTVQAHPQGHSGAMQSFRATHDGAVNKTYYAAGLHLPAGRWQIMTDVRDGNWTGNVSFPLVVNPANGTTSSARSISGQTVTRFASGLVLIWAGWFIYRARHDLAEQRRQS